MNEASKRSTIYFEPQLHQALRLKAASTQQSVSQLVNEAVRYLLEEDRVDLAAFTERESEATITYEAFLAELKADGTL
ncbi:MAG: CopG family transcriptional regulator [Synechocystis sp.]|nr:CopG family transcriptional regulator [Synechocystis sp.]